MRRVQSHAVRMTEMMPPPLATAPVAPYVAGAIAVAALTHAYLWARLVRDTALVGAHARRATAALVLAAVLLPAGMLGLLFMRVLPRPYARPLMTVAFAYAGALFFLLLLLLAIDGWAVVSRRRRARRGAGLALLGTALLSGGAALQAARAPAVHERRVALAGLPPSLDGYRMVQLSDLHVGSALGRAFVEDVVEKANAARPDVVVITGDLVDGVPAVLAESLEPLRRLRARDGVYMVFGNHEVLSGAEAWRAFLPSLGIRVLRNECVAVGAYELAGLDEEADAAAFAGCRGSFVIALAHEPAAVALAARAGAALQLSGHTHGGQIFPLHLFEWLDQRYVAGLYTVGATQLHVSAGAGFWGPPMRLGSRAEVNVLVLARP